MNTVTVVKTLLLREIGAQHKMHAQLLAPNSTLISLERLNVLQAREGSQREFFHINRETIERNIIVALCFGHPGVSSTFVHTFPGIL